MSHRGAASRAASVALLVSLCLPPAARAVGSGPAPAPSPAAPRSAEAEYNRGLRAKAAQRFSEAAAAFRRALDLRADFPEAWNELGFALRQAGQYGEALQAYDRALHLRPDFPEALEYLGEAYVKLGRLEDARAILTRLNGLDPVRARELREAIQAGQ